MDLTPSFKTSLDTRVDGLVSNVDYLENRRNFIQKNMAEKDIWRARKFRSLDCNLFFPTQEVVFFLYPGRVLKMHSYIFLPLHISIETTVGLSRPVGNLRHKFSKKYVKKLKTQIMQ